MNNRASLRFCFSLSLVAVAAAAALTSWNLLRVMHAFQNAEASGLLSVGRGIAEANQPLILALYFGIACALVAAVAYARVSNHSPTATLILSTSVLATVPLVLVWVTESLMLDALPSSRNGVVANAPLIQSFLFITSGSGAVLSVIFSFGWALRVSPTIARKRTVATVSLLIGCFVLALIGFHLRNAWLYGLYEQL